MKPLKIVFHLRFPIAVTFPWIAFDGLLAHLELRRRDPDAYWLLPSKTPLNLDIEIPVGKLKGVYRTSSSIFEPKKIFQETIYKRFETKGSLDISKKRKKVHINQGYFKNFMIALPYIPVEKVVFYAFGDRQRIIELLSLMPGLGKKIAIGYGEIDRFEVIETEKDYSLFKGGLAMRPIPVDRVKRYKESALLAYTFPYWDKTLVKECVVPFTEAEPL